MTHLLMIALIGLFARATDNTCAIVTPPGTGIEQRVRVLGLDGGRTIRLFGQNHGDRLELRKLEDYVKLRDDSNDLWLWTMDGVLDSNKKAIAQAQEEAGYISRLLTNDSSIKYIGLEMTPDVLPDHLRHSERFQDDLVKELARRKVSRQITPFVLGFSGSMVYLKLVSPGLFKKRQIFAMESKKEVDAHNVAEDAYDQNLKKLKDHVDWSTIEGQSFLEKISETEKELLTLYPSYTPDLDKQIMSAALDKTPPKYKSEVSDWIASSLREMKAMKRRDEKVAESLFSKNDGSVIATMGLAHLDSVAQLLKKKCDESGSSKLILPTGAPPGAAK